MPRIAVLLLVAAAAAQMVGCGGGNGSSNTTVRIQSTQFSPQNVTIQVGDRVQWVNNDNVQHKVVSGTLLGTTSPQVLTPIININQNNSFVPSTFEATLNDTVQFQNNRSSSFVMDIVNESGNVVASLSFVQTGQVIQFSGFSRAGYYTCQQRDNPLFAGTITVSGTPNPDNRFQSQTLYPNGTFTTTFNSTGTYRYYDLNQSDPNQSFMTGTVTVQ